MTPQIAKLTGFIGIAKGLGVESIELDLSGLDGLIALEGDNGMGKTTFLENLQPFRRLPSRSSKLKSHCFLKNSQKELIFTMNGDEFRTLVKMDATTTRGDEGYIWHNGKSVVDGKVTNFDSFLAELLGSQNLFFNSIFCAQNSSKISDMRPAELKALFAEFLRLHRYIGWEDTSKQIYRLFDQACLNEISLYEKLDQKIRMLGDPHQDKKNAERVAARLEIDIAELGLTIDQKMAELDELKKLVLQTLTAQEKMKHLIQEKERLDQELKKTGDEYETKRSINSNKTARLKDELVGAEKILEQKAEIETAAKTIKDHKEFLAAIEKEIPVVEIEVKDHGDLLQSQNQTYNHGLDLRKKLDAMGNDAEIQAGMDRLGDRIKNLDKQREEIANHPELIRIQALIEAQEKSAAVLDDIDPACTSEICGLITQSLDDKKALPATRAKYVETKTKLLDEIAFEAGKIAVEINNTSKKVEARLTQINIEKTEVEARIKEVADAMDVVANKQTEAEQKLGKLRLKRQDYGLKIDQLQSMADKQAAINIAESRKVDIDKQLKSIYREDANAAQQYHVLSKNLAEEIAYNSAQRSETVKLIDSEANKRHDALAGELQDLIKEQNENGKLQEKNNYVLKAVEKEIAQLDALETERMASKLNQNHFKSEMAYWKYLQEACSKNGLRALEIEGVAPVISNYANEMLTATFGPTKTVRFQTQDDEGREVLQIIVIDEDGSETLLENLSGGERVWIIKAMTLAQTLISQEKSGRHFQTSLMDEEDGALSNDKAMKFIRLYGTLMEMAKMNNCYYISHRPDAIAMADHRLRFRKGGISII